MTTRQLIRALTNAVDDFDAELVVKIAHRGEENVLTGYDVAPIGRVSGQQLAIIVEAADVVKSTN